MSSKRAWVTNAIKQLNADATRSADTHLLRFRLPPTWGVDLYVKDESSHPTGSLKHRLARSLFLYGLVGGHIGPNTLVTEASSGSTAVSEAYFAQLLGLELVAVVPQQTSRRKIELIEEYGGRCTTVATAEDVYAEAQRIANEAGGYYLDQFGNASIATDWRGNNNIACSIFEQMVDEPHPEPAWIVVGAGTGGTCATIGRYVRYHGVATRVAMADPEGSVYEAAWRSGDRTLRAAGSRIEGIGRPRVESSFLPEVIDLAQVIPDVESIAAMQVVSERLGIAPGPSTGTSFALALELIERMRDAGQRGSVVILLCDRGDRYADTYYDAEWLHARGIDPRPAAQTLRSRLAEHRAAQVPREGGRS